MPLVHPLLAANSDLQLAAENSPAIRRGSRGPAVAVLQQAFVRLDYAMPRSTQPDGTLDGVFGSEMFGVVQAFQRANALASGRRPADGIVGRNVMRVLDSRLVRLGTRGRSASLTVGAVQVPQPQTATSTATPAGLRTISSALMQEAYEGFRNPGDGAAPGMPCTRQENGSLRVRNQCAVRMSIALAHCNCGFDFSRWTHGLVHDDRGLCRNQPAHVTGSIELADYLETLGLIFTRHDKARNDRAEGSRIMALYRGVPGIVFFRHISPPEPGTPGNHIDFWNRRGEIMNVEMNYHAAREPNTSLSYFVRADQVRFARIGE